MRKALTLTTLALVAAGTLGLSLPPQAQGIPAWQSDYDGVLTWATEHAPQGADSVLIESGEAHFIAKEGNTYEQLGTVAYPGELPDGVEVITANLNTGVGSVESGGAVEVVITSVGQ